MKNTFNAFYILIIPANDTITINRKIVVDGPQQESSSLRTFQFIHCINHLSLMALQAMSTSEQSDCKTLEIKIFEDKD